MDLSQALVVELAQRCAEETNRFFAQLQADNRFCFELFRRALVDRDDDAYTAVYVNFQGHVVGWIARDSLFPDTNEEANYFVPAAFYIFFKAINREKFAHFDELPRLLSYLKFCAHTSLLQYWRQERHRDRMDSLGQLPTSREQAEDSIASLGAGGLWRHIETVLKDERERRIAYAVFVLGYKPGELPTIYPQYVQDARDVTLLLYQIRKRLRNDPDLQGWL